MKLVNLLLVLGLGAFTVCFGQLQTPSEHLFAQGMYSIEQSNDVQSLEEAMRSNPNISIVRLDQYSNRFFILTQNISSLTEEDLRSWFGEFGDRIDCIQIGLHGVDQVNPFPFTNCSNKD